MAFLAVVPSKSLEEKVTGFLSKLQSSAVGLAILIGCKTSSCSNHSPLGGVERDLYLLQCTFSQLGFDTVELFDPMKEEIVDFIDIIKGKLHARSLFYNYVVVTFSGHGDQTKLFSRDGCLSLMDDIVNPIISEHPIIPKLFFVDACRGDMKDVGVAYTFDTSQHGRIRARGAQEEVNLPRNGNYLLAYSTLAGMKSFEDDMNGSYWMQFLSEELLHNNGKSILDLLTIVNQSLIKEFNRLDSTLQQPILVSCLNLVLTFERIDTQGVHLKLPEIDDKDYNQKAIQSLDGTGEEENNLDINIHVQLPRQDSDTQLGYHRGVLNLFKQKGIIVGTPKEKFVRDKTNEQQYSCTITAELENKCSVEGESRYMPKKNAEEEAAENVYLKIKEYVPCLREGPLASSSSASLLRSSLTPPPTTPTAPMTRSCTPGKTPKSKLKEFCDQKWKGKKVEYDTNPVSKGFIATATLPDGFTKTGNVRSSKKDAENLVAELILSEVNIK